MLVTMYRKDNDFLFVSQHEPGQMLTISGAPMTFGWYHTVYINTAEKCCQSRFLIIKISVHMGPGIVIKPICHLDPY